MDKKTEKVAEDPINGKREIAEMKFKQPSNVTNVTFKKGKSGYKRPSNDDLINHLQKCGGILSAVSSKLGVSRMTVKRWVDSDPELQAARFQAKESLVDLAESVLVGILRNSDESPTVRMTTAIYVTKTLGKDRGYSERAESNAKRTIRVFVGDEEQKSE